jgi:RNA polymerase sigma-70 factor (ECF subfamily)
MPDADTEHLLERAAAGDADARNRLLERHRGRLKRMVAVRADPRLAARLDPSDIVQESLADAARKLDGYLRERPLPFYPWLRRLALERLAALHRRHAQARRRSVTREEEALGLADRSALLLADRLFARNSSPSARLRRDELRVRVRAALGRLPERDREVLVLRHLEGLPAREIAAVLGTTEGAVNTRHVRALQRLRELLGPDFLEGE